MPIIKISLFIKAPIQVCFDLSRSIDLHMESTSHTNERAIKGRTSGLIELGETVTWEATHFGIRQQLTSIITEFAYIVVVLLISSRIPQLEALTSSAVIPIFFFPLKN